MINPGDGNSLLRCTDYLAGPDFVAVACETADGVKVYILKHRPQSYPG